MIQIRRLSQFKNDYAIMAVSLLQRNPIVMRPLSPINWNTPSIAKFWKRKGLMGHLILPRILENCNQVALVDRKLT